MKMNRKEELIMEKKAVGSKKKATDAVVATKKAPAKGKSKEAVASGEEALSASGLSDLLSAVSAPKPAGGAAPRKRKNAKSESAPAAKEVESGVDYPSDMYFTEKHIWVRPSEEDGQNVAFVGISDSLWNVIDGLDFVDLPSEGDELATDTPCMHLHSGSRVRHFNSPLTGRVIEVNNEVLDDPSLLFVDFRANWLFKMEYDDKDELGLLMDSEQYVEFLDEH